MRPECFVVEGHRVEGTTVIQMTVFIYVGEGLGCWSMTKQVGKKERVVKPSAMSLLTTTKSPGNRGFVYEGGGKVVWKPCGSEKNTCSPEICRVQKDALPLLKVAEGGVVSSGFRWMKRNVRSLSITLSEEE